MYTWYWPKYNSLIFIQKMDIPMKLLFNERRHLSVRLGTDSDWLIQIDGKGPIRRHRQESIQVWLFLLGFGTLYSIWTIGKNIGKYISSPTSIRTETKWVFILGWFRVLTEDLGFSINSICWMFMFVWTHSTQGGAWEHFLIRHMDWKKIFQYFMEIILTQTRTLHWHISITLIWMISLLILLLNLLFWE